MGTVHSSETAVDYRGHIPEDSTVHNIILQHPVALCILTPCSHVLPFSCNFVDIQGVFLIKLTRSRLCVSRVPQQANIADDSAC
jgi:hypothetical protein